LIDGTFTYNSAAEDKIQVIYYTSTGDFTLTSNQFIGINSFNEDDVLDSVNDGESKYYTGIYISGITTVTSTENYFRYFNYNKFGGVFFID